MNNDTPADAITVAQADRDAVSRYCVEVYGKNVEGRMVRDIQNGKADDHPLVQFAARHRTTSLAAQGNVPQFAYAEWWRSLNETERAWIRRQPDETRENVFKAGYKAALQDGLVDAAGKMWETLTYIRAASDCDASRNAADEVMRQVEPALASIDAVLS